MKRTETMNSKTGARILSVRSGMNRSSAMRFAMPALVMFTCLCGCRSAAPSALLGAVRESAAPLSPRSREVHISAVALIGPLLDLTYTDYCAQKFFYRIPVPEERATRGVNACDWDWRIHVVLSISGPPEELSDVSSFVHSQTDQELLVDVFDAASGTKLSPSFMHSFVGCGFPATEHPEDVVPTRSKWEVTRVTRELGMRVLILPVDLRQAPSADGRILVSLQPMEKLFRESIGGELPIVVDTRLVELRLSEP